ncbi:substrate-binding periplasmic protein [Dongshaea marina]|uniref:substrate-binding periplasmic protein n=1 Tax=Dongshaea marina TaxID=2047966 RepID=UPI00131F280A|nr:transporter substrate-binding domain-containing protein [Dongshaea marina]
MFKRLFYGGLCLLVVFSAPLKARTLIKVGGYAFAPFVQKSDADHYQGISLQMIQALNQIQSRYQFVFVPTTPKSRYQAFERHRFDMLLFESKRWGWKGYPVETTKEFLTGGELYIALNKEGRDQHYFDKLSNKRLIGVLGYHYGFASFNSDPNWLHSKFKILLVKNNQASIDALLKGRGDIATVTVSFLYLYLHQHPELKGKLLISKKMDQLYHHTILIRQGSRPSVDELEKMLDELKKNGTFDRLFHNLIGPVW